MNTRKIGYIEVDEDVLQKEADWALSISTEERFRVYCHHIATNYLLAGIDVTEYPVKRNIYYMDKDDES